MYTSIIPMLTYENGVFAMEWLRGVKPTRVPGITA